MREIIFKAKRTDNGKWVEGFYVCCRKCHYILPIFNEYESFHGFDDRYDDWIEVDISTLCQYTGLTDENSKKIWENDIVHNGNYFIVKWNEKCVRFDLVRIPYGRFPIGEWKPLIIDWRTDD